MLIVSRELNSNGSRTNQSFDHTLEDIPEGYVSIPPELEAEATALLPWLVLELGDNGEVVGVAENTEARMAHLSAPADAAEPDAGS